MFILAACRGIKAKSCSVGVLQLPEMQQEGDRTQNPLLEVESPPFPSPQSMLQPPAKVGHLVYLVSLGLVLKNKLWVSVNRATARL